MGLRLNLGIYPIRVKGDFGQRGYRRTQIELKLAPRAGDYSSGRITLVARLASPWLCWGRPWDQSAATAKVFCPSQPLLFRDARQVLQNWRAS